MQQPTCSAAGSSGSGTWRDMNCGLRFKTLADSAGSKVIHSTFELGMLFCGIEDGIQKKKSNDSQSFHNKQKFIRGLAIPTS
jgi:hypothetical protein